MKNNNENKVTGTLETLAWPATNYPSAVLTIPTIGKDYNLYNYKDCKGNNNMKVANVLGAGGTVILEGVEYRLEDEDMVRHYQLEQLQYALNTYKKLTGEAARLAKVHFKDRDDARRILKSQEYLQNKELYKWKTNVLDILEPQLAQAQEKLLLAQELKEAGERRLRLYQEMLQAGVRTEDFKKEIPNQDTTIAFSPSIEVQHKVGEFGPYTTFTGRDRSTHLDEVEAKIVNTWYYNREEFRVPTLEDQLEELAELREWFQTYKDNARRQGLSKPQQATIDKFERLEHLEIEVSDYLDERIQAEYQSSEVYAPEQILIR